MISNVGTVDRVIRFIVAAVLFDLGLNVYANYPVGIGLTVAGAIALLTSLVGFCGLYRLLGISTRKTDSAL